MPTTIRHQTTPIPYSCRWCGVEKREHAIHYTPGHPDHTWTQPTQKQINARLRARLARSRAARLTTGDRVLNA